MNEPVVSIARIAAPAVDAAFSGLPVVACPWLIGTRARLLFEADYVTDKQKLDVRELGDV